MRRLPTRSVALVAAVALALGSSACGSDADDAGTTTSTTQVTATTAAPASTSTTTAPATTTTEAGATTTTEPPDATTVPEGDLPGQRTDIYPYEGAELSVIGVAADDTLNLRQGPGTSFDELLRLGPVAGGAIATGHNRTLDDGSFWVEAVVDGKAGWANGTFLSQAGATVDITDQLRPAEGDTVVDLGLAVADQRASDEPPSTVTVVDGPVPGDPGEVTVDVVGLGDDAQRGERLRIVVTGDAAGGSLAVRTVEATTLCARGVSAEGLCV